MQEKIDAVILAGDKKGSKPIMGVNKVYLEIEGRPLLIHTLSSVIRSSLIQTVYLVGNSEKILQTLRHYHFQRAVEEGKVKIIDQGNTIIENIWRCYLYSIDGTFVETEQKKKENEEKMLFIVTGDSPLITVEEIDDFILGRR